MKGFHETKSPEFVLFSSDKWADKWHMCGVSRVRWRIAVTRLLFSFVIENYRCSVESDGKYAQI